MIKDISRIKGFIVDFQSFQKSNEKNKIAYYKAKYDGFLSGYTSLRKLIRKFEENEASNFNVFELLGVETKEVETHSAFLTNLLNPNGNHCQNDLFLSYFINKHIPEIKRKNFILDDFDYYIVEKEKAFFNGRIDLFISSMESKKRFAVTIENKINADDQPKQMDR